MTSCDSGSDVTPVDASTILGNWRVKTVKIDVQIKINGQIESASESRNGNSNEIIEVKSDGSISDASDIFGTSTYEWKYKLSGTELILGEPDDIGYFTPTTSGSTMKWHMNLQQARKSLNETDGFSSIFNVDADDIRNTLEGCDFTIEFEKI